MRDLSASLQRHWPSWVHPAAVTCQAGALCMEPGLQATEPHLMLCRVCSLETAWPAATAAPHRPCAVLVVAGCMAQAAEALQCMERR